MKSTLLKVESNLDVGLKHVKSRINLLSTEIKNYNSDLIASAKKMNKINSQQITSMSNYYTESESDGNKNLIEYNYIIFYVAFYFCHSKNKKLNLFLHIFLYHFIKMVLIIGCRYCMPEYLRLEVELHPHDAYHICNLCNGNSWQDCRYR